MSTATARRFHAVLEPIAVTLYFSAETAARYERAGLDTTQGYVCLRAAPMGRVAPDVVAASFYSFQPAMIAGALRWDVVSPEAMIDLRWDAAGATLGALFEDLQDGAEALAGTLEEAIAACTFDGRPIAAAHAALRAPDRDGILHMWHAADVLREYRGDGHIAVLLSHGLDATQALVLDSAYSGKPPAYYDYRSFEAERLAAARDALRARAFVDGDGGLTEGGAKFREMIEVDTDRLAAAPFDALGAERCARLLEDLAPFVERIIERRAVPRYVQRLYHRSFPAKETA